VSASQADRPDTQVEEEGGRPGQPAQAGKEGRFSVFWKVFGGTVLSISAMVAVTAYQGLGNQISDVRGDLKNLNTDLRKELGRLAEGQGDLVKKGEMNSRVTSVWDNMKDLRGDLTTLTTLKEKAAALERMLRAGEEERRRLAEEVRQLRQAQAGEEQRAELIREVRRLRERLSALEGRSEKGGVTPATYRREGGGPGR
jgi:DNA repair exonuclease SbcCD ATPase subunit